MLSILYILLRGITKKVNFDKTSTEDEQVLKDDHCTDNSLSQVTVDSENVITLSSDDESEFVEVIVTSINITLNKTEKYKNNTRKSVTCSASVGYSGKINHAELGENMPDLFRNI
jgi:hypothetical protein